MATTAEPRRGGPDPRIGSAGSPRIYLTGFMGAGKTVVGQALAALLGCRFVDLDRRIEARTGLSVEEIFERRGEEAFRDLEHRALAGTADLRPAVIATGGGLMTFERNRELLRRLGVSVWLDPSFDTILARLDEDGRRRRPLFRDPDRARRLHRERLAAYARADFRIAVEAVETAEEVAARIARLFEGAFCDT